MGKMKSVKRVVEGCDEAWQFCHLGPPTHFVDNLQCHVSAMSAEILSGGIFSRTYPNITFYS